MPELPTSGSYRERVEKAGGIEAYQKLQKALADKKAQKGAKAVTGLLKGLGPIGAFVSSIPGLTDMLKPLMMILKPFEPFMKIIAGLLSSLMGAVIKPMFEAFKPLFGILISFMPIFAKIGGIIGKVIGMLIRALIPVIEPMLPIIILLAKGFGMLIIIGLLPLLMIVYAVGLGIASVVDFISAVISIFTGGPRTNWVGDWNGIMMPLIGGTVAAIPEIMAMGTGGYVPGSSSGTIMRIGEGGQGEHVVRGDTIDELSRNQEQTNYYLRKLVMLKEEKW